MSTTNKYKKHLMKASYMNQNDAQKYMAKYGYKYDPELSRNDTKVFLGPDGKPVVAHRGSRRVTDFIDDALIMLNLPNHRTNNAKRTNERVKQKYGNYDAIGHSLGGNLASKSDADKIITYNKLATPFDNLNKENETSYRTKNDLPSYISQYSKNTVTIPDNHLLKTVLTAHDLKNFTENNNIKYM